MVIDRSAELSSERARQVAEEAFQRVDPDPPRYDPEIFAQYLESLSLKATSPTRGARETSQ